VHGTGGNDERCTVASRERKLNVFCAVGDSFNVTAHIVFIVTAHIVVEQVRMKQTTTLNCAG